MKIYQIFAENLLRNFSYLIVEDGQAYCIDPFDALQIYSFIKNHHFVLKAILNTHEHWDHHQGNRELQGLTGCEVWANPHSLLQLKVIDRPLQDGDEIKLGNTGSLKVYSTPGHTMNHQCFMLFDNENPYALFSGDTLFNAGVGNCHSGGNPEILFETIKNFFFLLPDELIVYPGHDYLKKNLEFSLILNPNNQVAIELNQKYQDFHPHEEFIVTTMKTEKKINPFFNLEKEAFLRLRKQRDQF